MCPRSDQSATGSTPTLHVVADMASAISSGEAENGQFGLAELSPIALTPGHTSSDHSESKRALVKQILGWISILNFHLKHILVIK